MKTVALPGNGAKNFVRKGGVYYIQREGLESTFGTLYVMLKNSKNVFTMLLYSFRITVVVWAITGRSSGRARDGSFNGWVVKKENESSSMFKRNKMTWKSSGKIRCGFVAWKEKRWKEKWKELENLTSFERKLEKENFERLLDRRNHN